MPRPVVPNLKSFTLALAASLLLCFGAPVRAQEQPQLLLFPDPVDIAPGESALIDLRLHTTTPVEEIDAVLLFDTEHLYFSEVFTGSSTIFRFKQSSIDGQEMKLLLEAPGGFVGRSIIGRILVTATDEVEPGTSATLGFRLDETKLTTGEQGPTPFSLRPTQVRVLAPESIEIDSKTHADENVWHSRRSVNINWDAKPDTLYSYEISLLPTVVPDGSAEDKVADIELHNLVDGVYTFALCELVRNECVGTSKRRIMIDGTAPLPITVTLEEGETGRSIRFSAHDELSGIAEFEISLDPEGEGDRAAWVTVESPYQLPQNYLGGDILIRALDRAGNEQIARISVPKSPPFLLWALILLVGTVLLHMLRKRLKGA